MRNTILILIGILAVYIGLTSFHANNESDGITYKVVETDKLEDASPENLESTAYYEDFLEELAVPSPKEEGYTSKALEAEAIVPVDVIIDEVAVDAETEDELKEKDVVTVETKNEPVKEETNVAIVDHSAFGKLLKKYVDSKGNVNYKGFKNDIAALDAYLAQLSANPVQSSMSKNERLAYWINAYNAFTIKLILDNYPIKSITDLEGGKPWDKVFIKLGNTSYSLNMIENGIIRKRFTEPRIHFAVNCAAKSCPPLLNDAFYPNSLTDQLGKQTKSFLNDASYNTITSSKLQVSKIFEWYGEDFKDVKEYINSRVDADLKNVTLTFKEYDWTLNEQ